MANLFALLYVMFSFVCVSFPGGVLGQVWYLILSIPDLCILLHYIKTLLRCILFNIARKKAKIRNRYHQVPRATYQTFMSSLLICFHFISFTAQLNRSVGPGTTAPWTLKWISILPIYLSVCSSVCMSVNLYVGLSEYLSMYMPVCLKIYIFSMYLSFYLPVCLYYYLSMYLSVFLS